MKKKTIWIAVAVLVIAVLLVVLIPRPLLGKEVSVSAVFIEFEDVTDQVDTERLTEILSGAKTMPSFDVVPNYTAEEYPIEINLISDRKTLHIVMGKKNFSYRGGNLSMRTILDGEKLYEQVEELIG